MNTTEDSAHPDSGTQSSTGDNYESSAADSSVAVFDEERGGALLALQRFLHRNPTTIPIFVLALSLGGFWFWAGDRFFSAFNLGLIIQQVSIIGILAAGQSLIILTAGIDLSVAAIMILMSVIMGKLAVTLGVPSVAAIPIGLIGGMLAGGFNGFLVTRVKLPPFIATLGTWNIFFALTLWLSSGQSIRSQAIDKSAPVLKIFGEHVEMWGARITYGSILMLVIFAVLWYLLNRTAWGRHVYAVGDDKEAAELAGIQTDRVLMSVYVLAGLICAIGAWASIGRVGSVSPTSFSEGNLQSITAVVIGGISLFGGRGAIFGPLIGALIVGVFQSGLRIAQVDVLWQVFAIGWLVIIAVAIDQWIRKVSA